MKNKEYSTLKRMIEYIDKSLKYTNDYSYEEFCEDEKTIDAVVFNISQIGELVNNLSEELKNKYSKIEWNMIKGLRNRIVHDYAGISLKSIWYVIKFDLEELKEDILLILEKEKSNIND